MRARCSWVGLAVVLAGCTPVEPVGETSVVGEASPAAVPSVAVQPVPVDQSCAAGPPMGDLRAYSAASGRLMDSDIGIRVRTCAVWPASDLRNVIGTIEAGQWIPMFGPLKHGAFSAGIGYAVPLVDPEGRHCRGYVSAIVLDEVQRHPTSSDREGLPLPDGRDAWVGPCDPEG